MQKCYDLCGVTPAYCTFLLTTRADMTLHLPASKEEYLQLCQSKTKMIKTRDVPIRFFLPQSLSESFNI